MVNGRQAATILPNGEEARGDDPLGMADVRMDADGRIVGIDGMLSQIAGALAGEAAPVIRREILPVLQADRELQRTVGAAAGRALGRELRPYAAVAALALAVLAGVSLARWADRRRASGEGDRG